MATDHLSQLVERASEQFRQQFGRAPRWIVAAPGRVNLIGEHVDYNDGFVLPMAIDRYCVIAGDVAEAGSAVGRGTNKSAAAKLFSAAAKDSVEISLAAPQRHPTPGHWSNYFAGVIAGCINRGMRPEPFEAIVDSTVSFGGGLSSSAAIEVATATLIEAMTGITLDPVAKALLCQQAEHDFAVVPCGVMDQFASVLGRLDHLMLLDCRSLHVEHIPLTDPAVTVLITNTNVKHELSGGEYAERRGQCEVAARKLGVKSLRDISFEQLVAASNGAKLSDVEFRRARHVITEIDRTAQAAAAIRAGHWPTVGVLMYASHESLRVDFEVSCGELDLLVDLASGIGLMGGVIGSRMTGGGFGGCTVSLVETSRVAEISQIIVDSYHDKTGIKPSLITSRPARART